MGGQRKTLDQQIVEAKKDRDDIAKKILELEKEAKVLARKRETRRKCVLGAIADAEAEADGDFQALFEKAIRARIRERDKDVLPEYFPECSSGQTVPERPSEVREAVLASANPP